jgi:hypothetical protein
MSSPSTLEDVRSNLQFMIHEDIGVFLQSCFSSIQEGNAKPAHHTNTPQSDQEKELCESYVRYLNSEWFYTISDLQLAAADSALWASLKLPGRLKIEMKRGLQAQQSATITIDGTPSGTPSPEEASSPEEQTHEEEEGSPPPLEGQGAGEGVEETKEKDETWIMVYSPEDDCYYYYNGTTDTSQWECPDDSKAYDAYDENPYWGRYTSNIHYIPVH